MFKPQMSNSCREAIVNALLEDSYHARTMYLHSPEFKISLDWFVQILGPTVQGLVDAAEEHMQVRAQMKDMLMNMDPLPPIPEALFLRRDYD